MINKKELKEIEILEKRLRHLLQSKTIREYDEKNFHGNYKKDIKKLDEDMRIIIYKKVPLFCRIKKYFTIPSPSSTYFCGLGFRYRLQKMCKNCPMKNDSDSIWNKINLCTSNERRIYNENN